jgi:hypothetical protein
MSNEIDIWRYEQHVLLTTEQKVSATLWQGSPNYFIEGERQVRAGNEEQGMYFKYYNLT